MPYLFYAPTNIAVLSQSNQQFGANVALGAWSAPRRWSRWPATTPPSPKAKA